MTEPRPLPIATEFHLERYKYLLSQLHATNENVYRFLALYQTLVTALAGVALALFAGHQNWGIDADTAKAAIVGLMVIITIAAGFTVLLIIVGILNWLDYRGEEVELTDEAVRPGFRRPPRVRNFVRWHETYVVAFVVTSVAGMWVLTFTLLLPAIG